MGLLDFINTDESYEYISLKEAIIFLKEKTNSTIQEVAIYLLNKGVPSDLACHTKGSDYKIKETSGKHFSYGMFRPYGRNWAFEYLTNISESYNCATWDELKNYNHLWEDWGIPLDNDNVALLEKTYWYRQAFLNLEPIKSLNLFDENLLELNPSLIPIWDESYLNILNADDPDSKVMDFDTFIEDMQELDKEELKAKTFEAPLFYLNDVFSLIEASCLLSGDIPTQINRCFNDTNFDQNYPFFDEAYSFINSAIWAGSLPENLIPSHQLKIYLQSKGKIIDGFNDNLPTQEPIGCGQPSIQQTELNIENLNAEIARLKELVAEKDEENKLYQQREKAKDYLHQLQNLIKESDKDSKINEQQEKIDQLSKVNEQLSNEIFSLKQRISTIASMKPDLINLTPEQEIPHSTQRNNVSKLILVLAKMAKIDITRPHSPYESLSRQAQILGVDKFPNDDTVAKWFKKAIEFKNQNPN